MASTYELIASQTLGSGGAASITFSGIPATFTDLVLHVSARTSRANNGDYILLKLNGAEANSGRSLWGYSTTVVSGTAVNNILIVPAATAAASTFSSVEIYVPNYTSTTSKSVTATSSAEDNAASSQGNSAGVLLWSSGSAATAAITSVTLTGRFNSFVEFSSAYLYGITKA